jgi:membrane-bound serine protease (ClpP class)
MLLVLALVAALLWLPSPLGWSLVGLAAAYEILQTVLGLRWSRRRQARVGVEDLVGREAVVAVACRPRGQVRVFGELWQAVCAQGADVGDRVVVEEVDGLTLTVAPRH